MAGRGRFQHEERRCRRVCRNLKSATAEPYQEFWRHQIHADRSPGATPITLAPDPHRPSAAGSCGWTTVGHGRARVCPPGAAGKLVGESSVDHCRGLMSASASHPRRARMVHSRAHPVGGHRFSSAPRPVPAAECNGHRPAGARVGAGHLRQTCNWRRSPPV